MIETDAPFMGFVKGRRRCEPADLVSVAAQMASVLGVPASAVAAETTRNAEHFFRLEQARERVR